MCILCMDFSVCLNLLSCFLEEICQCMLAFFLSSYVRNERFLYILNGAVAHNDWILTRWRGSECFHLHHQSLPHPEQSNDDEERRTGEEHPATKWHSSNPIDAKYIAENAQRWSYYPLPVSPSTPICSSFPDPLSLSWWFFFPLVVLNISCPVHLQGFCKLGAGQLF